MLLLTIRLMLDENGAEILKGISVQVVESALSPGVIRHAPGLWRKTVAHNKVRGFRAY